MNCYYCQKEISEKDNFCPYCGTMRPKVWYSQSSSYYKNQNQEKINGFAIAGFVLSFLSPIFGLLFSIIGLAKVKETYSGEGIAKAGIIISVVIMLSSIILAILLYNTYLELLNSLIYLRQVKTRAVETLAFLL